MHLRENFPKTQTLWVSLVKSWVGLTCFFILSGLQSHYSPKSQALNFCLPNHFLPHLFSLHVLAWTDSVWLCTVSRHYRDCISIPIRPPAWRCVIKWACAASPQLQSDWDSLHLHLSQTPLTKTHLYNKRPSFLFKSIYYETARL